MALIQDPWQFNNMNGLAAMQMALAGFEDDPFTGPDVMQRQNWMYQLEVAYQQGFISGMERERMLQYIFNDAQLIQLLAAAGGRYGRRRRHRWSPCDGMLMPGGRIRGLGGGISFGAGVGRGGRMRGLYGGLGGMVGAMGGHLGGFPVGFPAGFPGGHLGGFGGLGGGFMAMPAPFVGLPPWYNF